MALQISPNGETSIAQSEVKNALDLAGYKLPNHRVRELLGDLKAQGKLSADQNVPKEIFKEVVRSHPN